MRARTHNDAYVCCVSRSRKNADADADVPLTAKSVPNKMCALAGSTAQWPHSEHRRNRGGKPATNRTISHDANDEQDHAVRCTDWRIHRRVAVAAAAAVVLSTKESIECESLRAE